MIRTSHRDVNFVSIAGNNSTQVDDPAQPTVYVAGPGIHTLDGLTIVPVVAADSYDSILKIDDSSSSFSASGIAVGQGLEASVDINNHVDHVSLNGKFGVGVLASDKPNAVISIKGGCSFITITGTLYARGDGYDIDLGNWSDESYNNNTSIVLNVTHVDGRPVRVRVGHSDKPTGSGFEIVWWPSIESKANWWGKWVLVKTVFKWFPSLNKQAGT